MKKMTTEQGGELMIDKLKEIDRCFESAIKNYECLNHEASRNCCIEGRRLIAALAERVVPMALASEQREKLLALAGDCWDRDWDVNQAKVDELIAYVNELLLAAAQPGEPACPICHKPLSYGISWCKTCDVTHAVSCVECYPCGYINEGP